MGQYTSRGRESLQDVWRTEWRRSYGISAAHLQADCAAPGPCPAEPSLHDLASHATAEMHGALEGGGCSKAQVNELSDKHGGLAPLHLAAVAAGEDAVRWLLKAGADVNLLSELRHCALHLACGLGEEVVAQVLLDEGGADVDVAGGFQHMRAIHFAAFLGRVQIIRLLAEHGCDLDAQDKNGFTALCLATHFGHEEAVSALLEVGASAHLASEAGDTALLLACQQGSVRIAELLLTQKGLNVEEADAEQCTAVHYCCRSGVVDLLPSLMNLPHFASFDCLTVYLDTPLHIACYHGQYEAAAWLLRQFGYKKFHSPNLYGDYPLHCAATAPGRCKGLLQMLAKQSLVDVNSQGADGHTALHSACFHGNASTIETLIGVGADPTLLSRDGSSCIQVAHDRGHDEIAATLLEFLCDDGQTTPRSILANGLTLPSPRGVVRSVTQEKAEVLELRQTLPADLQASMDAVVFLEPIASGSFGTVFKADYQGRLVAVKQYKKEHFRLKSDINLFCREVSILSILDHPNVLRFVGACLEQPVKFAIMTVLVPGGSLFSVLHVQKRALNWPRRLCITTDIARGMGYLHSRPSPIIHRDLTTHNILLDDRGSAVIADFGESCILKQRTGAEDGGLTKQPGNLRWMAPEIFSRTTLYTVKIDVFSYGLCVWEIATGKVPFESLKPAAAAAEMAFHGNRPTIPASCPRPIAQLCQKAWDADADRRPSFKEIIQWLCSHFGTEGREAAPGGTIQLDAETEQRFSECLEGTSSPRQDEMPASVSLSLLGDTRSGYVSDVLSAFHNPSPGS